MAFKLLYSHSSKSNGDYCILRRGQGINGLLLFFFIFLRWVAKVRASFLRFFFCPCPPNEMTMWKTKSEIRNKKIHIWMSCWIGEAKMQCLHIPLLCHFFSGHLVFWIWALDWLWEREDHVGTKCIFYFQKNKLLSETEDLRELFSTWK